MKIRFLDIAQYELDDAIVYYNYESPGLGDEFLTEILSALNRISQFPKAWHSSSKRGGPFAVIPLCPCLSVIISGKMLFFAFFAFFCGQLVFYLCFYLTSLVIERRYYEDKTY